MLLQESVHVFQCLVGQEDNEEERRMNLHQKWIIPGPACILNSIVTMVVGIDAEGVDLWTQVVIELWYMPNVYMWSDVSLVPSHVYAVHSIRMGKMTIVRECVVVLCKKQTLDLASLKKKENKRSDMAVL